MGEYAPCAAAHALRRLRAGDHDCGGDAPVSVTEPCSQPFITSMTTRLVQQANTAFDTWLLCKAFIQGWLHAVPFACLSRLVTCTRLVVYVCAIYQPCAGSRRTFRDVHERQQELLDQHP